MRTRRVLREQWNGGDDGEKPRKARHFRNCREGSAAAVTEFQWKLTPLDWTANFFEAGRSETAAGTSNEHFAECGRLQVKLGWLKRGMRAARGL